MARTWFRRRSGRRGLGYEINSIEGFLATVAFAVIVTAAFSVSLASTLLLGWDRPAASVAAAAASLTVVVAFLLFVRRKAG